MGTRGYRYNQSADIWSFGIVLLEMARGRAPLAHCAFTKIILDTVHGPAPSLDPGEHQRYSRVLACSSEPHACKQSPAHRS